jgi:hypothetical protein
MVIESSMSIKEQEFTVTDAKLTLLLDGSWERKQVHWIVGLLK